MMELFSDIIAWAVPVVLAITLHEAAHGWMAEKFGDDTARQLGRVTFNPLRHVDRFGTILLPGLLYVVSSPVLFGYAKPVPVNFYRLQPQRFGAFMVAIAGPATNVLLALLAGILLHLDQWFDPAQNTLLFTLLLRMVVVNCVIAVFNMLPILPLDGGRVVASMLSGRALYCFAQLERFGIYLVMAALIVPQLLGFQGLGAVIAAPIGWLAGVVLEVTGNGQ